MYFSGASAFNCQGHKHWREVIFN